MKKSADADIRNLFRRFGGDADNYQEIQQEYVDSKATQSWPIVEAMEKERAKAPTLRSAAAQKGVAPVSKPAVSRPAVAHTPPVVTRQAPVAEAVRPSKQSGGLSALFSKPEPAPVRSLFSKPAPAPVRSLFSGLISKPNAMNQQEKSEQQTASVQPEQVTYSGNAPLNSVFSRLIKPQNPVNTRTPENGLRNMLGFLKKQ